MNAAAAVRAAVRVVWLRRASAPASTGAARRARSRATVLLGLALVVLSQLGLTLVVESVRPQWRDPEFFHRRKNLLAMAHWSARYTPGRPVVVVIGSSRPQVGLSPTHLGFGNEPGEPVVFNCSQSGARPVFERLNLGRVLDTGLTPDFVLIEVIPALLGDHGPVDEQVIISRFGRKDMTRLAPYLTDPNGMWRKWLAAWVAPWFTLRHELLLHADRGDLSLPETRTDFLWREMRSTGWGPFYPVEWTAERRAQHTAGARKGYAAVLGSFRPSPVAVGAYRDMLAECRDRGIRAAVLVMPESPEFRSWYAPETRVKVRECLAGLSAEFGVPVFDTSAWVDDEAAFMDGHHLLGPAAERFSERLGRECIGPWVRGAR